MPHFISLNKFIQTNTQYKDFRITEYLYNVSFPNLSILPVAYKNDMIFIRCVKREKDYLYKVDKLTRIPDITRIKDLLYFMSKDLAVSSHNLNQTKKKHTKGLQTNFLIDLSHLSGIKAHFIEVGFGSGRHILELARKNPDKTIVGFEIHLPSIRQVMNAIEIYGLHNLYICNIDARLGIQVIPSHTVQKIFLHFPIPWNKAKHRRVFNRDFVEHSFRILTNRGSIDVRTDDLDFFQDCINECLSANYVHIEIYKNSITEVVSKYEQRWTNMQKDIYELRVFRQDLVLDTKNSTENFCFPTKVENLSQFCNRKWIEHSFFVSIGDLYESETSALHKISLAQLTFGSLYVPFSTYLVLEDNKVHYLKCPLDIHSHRLAHQLLCKILSQTSIKKKKKLKG